MHSRPGRAATHGWLQQASGTKGPLSVKQKSADPTKMPAASPSSFLVKQFSFFREAAPRPPFRK